jgi:transposase-like protein
MKQTEISLIDWQKRFATEEDCIEHLYHLRWSEGFICPNCGEKHHYFIKGYNLYECTTCGKRTSITAGTLFHSTKIPLVKWFTALYFVAVDKGGISAVRLAQYLQVSWKTANLMLNKLRVAMADRDAKYQLTGTVELDGAYVGGKDTSGKRGKGSRTKTTILVACEARDKGAGFLKMSVVGSENAREALSFCEEAIEPASVLKVDGAIAFRGLGSDYSVVSQVCSGSASGTWLPWVHIAIANLKRFLLGTFHGVSGDRLQGYLDEFCYRFNRRWWLLQIPERLLFSALNCRPIKRSALLL